MLTRFGSSPDYTLGVEEEFQIVDPETGDLVSRADVILDKDDPAYEEEVQSELFRSMVETATPVCADVDELREEMARLRNLLIERAQARDLAIAASGTHPFARWEEQELTDKDRYRELLRDLRLPIKRELVFGQHVHVAVPSSEAAIRVNNLIRPFLPLVLALSTNAPFWRGIDSGLESARVRVFDAMPRSGMPRWFTSWADLEGAVDLLKAAGSIEDMTKIWWDVRPRPELGTVEVRSADLPTSMERSHALAALVQALVATLAESDPDIHELPIGGHPEAIAENRWRASRYGVDAEFIELDGEDDVRTRSVPSMLGKTLGFAQPAVDELGLEPEMQVLERIVESGETGARRQRQVHEKSGELREVVRDIAARTPP